ncbi:TIGR03905 family TSCPD domain-containing protein [Fusibacter ferrireducens]|uniref:ribonucleoside-diphosphate reductase n=1 Tax=Fusibacter ferrireducens TaxID=2785058 RepID=A0ABR9ZUQ9_9FIRM|nr:TIGR03905 family TSCPD domain-containing protein [Fusibacter ferrireducens]MBF4694207.1 TIGR03905 family TSCPD domain-containing protein [Fusibacter ferrireducens]
MTVSYIPSGVCSKKIEFELENDTVKNVEFSNGCQGNLKAICLLVDGFSAQEIIDKFKGIQCKTRGTSCPDQLAKALEFALNR